MQPLGRNVSRTTLPTPIPALCLLICSFCCARSALCLEGTAARKPSLNSEDSEDVIGILSHESSGSVTRVVGSGWRAKVVVCTCGSLQHEMQQEISDWENKHFIVAAFLEIGLHRPNRSEME